MKKHAYLLAALTIAVARNTFDPVKTGWKLDADGKMEMKDGNPVYVDSTGAEKTLDAGTVSRLNGEARDFRVRAEAAETKLASFGDLDPTKAKEAIDKLAQIDQGQLIAAGKVDEVKAELKTAFEAQISERDAKLAEANSKIDSMRLDTAFATSEWVQNNVAVPVDILKAAFAGHFKNEGDTLVPYDGTGAKLHSKDRMGETANFDEAIEQLINARKDKDKLLLAEPKNGTGNDGKGGGSGNSSVVKRSDFDTKSPMEQAQIATDARAGKVTIVD